MSYNREVFEQVLQRYADKRAKAADTLAARKKEIYRQIPEIAAIDRQLRQSSVRLSMTLFDEKVNDVAAAIEQLRRTNLDLQAEKAELLVSHGYPYDYLSLHYECPKCKDEGYIGAAMCTCFKEALTKQAYLSSNMGTLVDKQNFAKFSLDSYSDAVDAQTGISPRRNMERILRFAERYVADCSPDQADNLLFVGQTGLGKTFLSSCIAKEIMDKGYSVIYDTAQNIFDNFENRKFGREESCTIDPERYFQCDLLIIDDLGSEYVSPLSSSFLYNILNTRSILGKPIIASTNLLPPEIERQYSGKVLSRIMGEFITLYFIGEDIRQKMLAQKLKQE